MNFHNMFPVPVFSNRLYRKLTKEEEESVENLCKNGMIKNIENLLSKENKILEKEKNFIEIREFIQKNLEYYFKIAYLKSKKIKPYITTSWLNVTKPGMSHHFHNHPNSLISGVFYFKTIPKDFIRFHSPTTALIKPLFNDESGNKYGYSSSELGVKDGHLLLFPSYLQHEVAKNESEETRISLAFNTFWRGKISSGINELEIM